jgi:hypothetical protein
MAINTINIPKYAATFRLRHIPYTVLLKFFLSILHRFLSRAKYTPSLLTKRVFTIQGLNPYRTVNTLHLGCTKPIC